MSRRSTVVVAFAAVSVVLVRLFETQRRYTFGHAHAVDLAVVTLLYLLAVTHVVVAGIMWLQRARWLPSEASMFRFIGVKAVFWSSLATSYQFVGRGVPLDSMLLFVLMSLTTIDLNSHLARRYLFGSEDALLFGDETDKPEPDDAWAERTKVARVVDAPPSKRA
jgi:hypothetical protein